MSVIRTTKNFYDYDVTDTLAYNLKSWLDYGLLETGAYTAVKFSLPTSGYTNLKRVYDDRYGNNRVFEGYGPSWVWESGITGIDCTTTTFQVSGVYINNSYFPLSTSGSFAHTVDYRRGRVVFNSAIPVGSSVKCEYVFRDVNIDLVDTPQWKFIVDAYEDRFEQLSTLSPSGMASVLKENRVWLPSIFISVNTVGNTGLQLGGGEIANCNVDYYVFTDNPSINNKLADLLTIQETKTLQLFDVNNAPFCYNFNGSLASGALTYPQLADRTKDYFWTFGHVDRARTNMKDSEGDLYRSEVSHAVSIERYLITY